MSNKFESLEELLKTELGECTEAPKVFVSYRFIKKDCGYMCNGPPCSCDNPCQPDCQCDDVDWGALS